MATTDRLLNLVILLTVCRFGAAVTNYYLDEHCGDTLSVDLYDQVRLRSVRYGTYNQNMACTLTVTAAYGSNLMVYFNGLSMESSSTCRNDFLELDDGSSRSSPYLGYKSKYCGSTYPSTVYTTSGRYLTIYFRSDDSIQYSGIDLIITQYHTGYCYSYEYECNNGRCIDDSVSCSLYNSCGDYSDCGVNTVLTVGGIAGAAIGSVFGVVIFVVVVTIVCRRRRAIVVGNTVNTAGGIQVVSSASSMSQGGMMAQPPPYNQAPQYGYNQPQYPQPTQYPQPPQPPQYTAGAAMPQPQNQPPKY